MTGLSPPRAMNAEGGSEEPTSSQGGAERIVVMARVRPLLSRESEFEELLEVKSKDILVAQGARAVSRYRFDDVFDKRATQSDVFRRAAPFVDASLRGFNSTVFAYGQTVRPTPPAPRNRAFAGPATRDGAERAPFAAAPGHWQDPHHVGHRHVGARRPRRVPHRGRPRCGSHRAKVGPSAPAGGGDAQRVAARP